MGREEKRDPEERKKISEKQKRITPIIITSQGRQEYEVICKGGSSSHSCPRTRTSHDRMRTQRTSDASDLSTVADFCDHVCDSQ